MLSWQELVSSPADITQITAHLQDARTRFLQNPRYARLGIKEINITEYGSSADQYRPGETVAYVSALEGGQADGAGRSCFSAPSGDSNCYNNTLDGLLGPSSGKPNGVWYVMATYHGHARRSGGVHDDTGNLRRSRASQTLPPKRSRSWWAITAQLRARPEKPDRRYFGFA